MLSLRSRSGADDVANLEALLDLVVVVTKTKKIAFPREAIFLPSRDTAGREACLLPVN